MAQFSRLLVRMPFGSQLYGTSTPDSDLDYKGVFVPRRSLAYLGRIPQALGSGGRHKAPGEKNRPGEIDDELFSIQFFMRMAIEGQTLAIDMLHAHPDVLIDSSNDWSTLRANKNRFYTKNLKAFVGYARRQAAKYGVKGSRLATARWAKEHLMANPLVRIRDLAPALLAAKMEHVHECDDPTAAIEILGKRLTAGAVAGTYIDTFANYEKNYGERARMAEKSEGVDWKAMSHAVRAAIEVERILLGMEWSLPFDEETADHLRAIKLAQRSFPSVQEELEQRISNLEELSIESDLPEKPDTAWADNFVVQCMEGSPA